MENKITSSSSEYTIQTLISGDATNLTKVKVNIPEKARTGETVNFTVILNDEKYSINSVKLSIQNQKGKSDISNINGVFSFLMPNQNVTVYIYLEYKQPIDSNTMYSIEYDTLGNGSNLSVDFQCVDKAAAGEKVTFTLKLVDLSSKFEDYYPLDITHIVLNETETGEEICDIGEGEGTFTFTMPSQSVTIMVYLMRKD